MFAFANKHPYHEVVISIPIRSKHPIAIAVHDRRRYVVDGTKQETYCGNMRSGVGILFDISTKSDQPLADDFMGILKHALKKNGNQLTIIPTRADENKTYVQSGLLTLKLPRLIYIEILEWKIDTYVKADLYCFLNLTILNQNGEVIGESTVKACREPYGGSFWNPKKAAQKGALNAVKMKLETLLNDEVVLKYLQS